MTARELPGLDGAVELLERALGHTRMALAGVRPVHLALPTPCARWDLDDLLWHMDDALDAFTEAASGLVGPGGTPRGAVAYPTPRPSPRAGLATATGVAARLGRMQDKACHLLGVWTDPAGGPVDVGGVPIDASVLLGAAALEITVHGWDVAQSTGQPRPIPADLASRLMPLAALTVDHHDRGRRFAGPVPIPGAAPADVRLLGFLGRTLRAADAA